MDDQERDPEEDGVPLGRALGCTLAFLATAGISASLGYAVLQRASAAARSTNCVNNLRQVGLGAIQYADDKRFLPHVLGHHDYDGDKTTDHASRAIGSLFYYGYADRPEILICPLNGDDRAYPGSFPADSRDWDWSGRRNPTPELSPIVAPALAPTLEDSIELSFAWSRRSLNTGMVSTTVLAADKSARDHGSGLARNVVYGDATVGQVKEEDPERQALEVLDRRGGSLSLVD